MPPTLRRSTSSSELFNLFLKSLETRQRIHNLLFVGYQQAPICSPAALGGYSDVYKLDVPHHGCIAVKRPRFNERERDARHRMLVNERTILRMMDHPNILPFIGTWRIGDRECIISPWATHGSLRLYLQTNPEADRLRLMRQIASALDYLHTSLNPVVHGDISIDNVLVSEAGSALLSDFGFSSIVSADDDTPLDNDVFKFHLGRVAYDAPELYEGASRCRATDIFAFGMLLFIVYAGKLPFARGHRGAVAYAMTALAMHRGERPCRHEITRTDFPEALWNLIDSCWNQDRAQRPRASQVLEQLNDSNMLARMAM